jgi:four helix bundle protein
MQDARCRIGVRCLEYFGLMGKIEPRIVDRGYKKLEIWRLARRLAVEIHKLSLALPKFEMYEEGSQIRRSSKSIRSNIVEGYGRRRYKQEFIRFLVFAQASCDETLDHLESLFDTGSLLDEPLYSRLISDLESLGSHIYRFIEAVETQHLSVKEERAPYSAEQQAISEIVND